MGKFRDVNEIENYFRALAEGAYMPAFWCNVRACRRAQCCVGPLARGSVPLCFASAGDLPPPLMDFLTLVVNLINSFTGRRQDLAWLHSTDPAQLLLAEQFLSCALPPQQAKAIRRWLAKVSAPPKPQLQPAPALAPSQQQPQHTHYEARRYDEPERLDDIWGCAEGGQQIGSETIVIRHPDGSRTAFAPSVESHAASNSRLAGYPCHSTRNTNGEFGTPRARLLG